MKTRPVVVPKLWPGSTVVCFATGPSLTAEDVDYVRGKAHTIAINDAYRLAPWAEVLYACDAKWWRWHHKHLSTFAGLKYALQPEAAVYGKDIQVLQNTGNEGCEIQPTGLRTGKNSGYQAINLAVHLGAVRIILLGYDMQRTNGLDHFFGAHPRHSVSPYRAFLRRFDTLVKPLARLGIEVINCTVETALLCFPRKPLREVLA